MGQIAKNSKACENKIHLEDRLWKVNDADHWNCTAAEWRHIVKTATEPITITFCRYKIQSPFKLCDIKIYVSKNKAEKD